MQNAHIALGVTVGGEGEPGQTSQRQLDDTYPRHALTSRSRTTASDTNHGNGQHEQRHVDGGAIGSSTNKTIRCQNLDPESSAMITPATPRDTIGDVVV